MAPPAITPPPAWYSRGVPKIPLAAGLPAFAASYWAIAQLGLSQDPHNWVDAATNPTDYFRGTKYSPSSALDWFHREEAIDPKTKKPDPHAPKTWKDIVAVRYLLTGKPIERFGMNYERGAAITDCMDEARGKGQEPRSCGVYHAMGEDREKMDEKAGWAALAMGYGGWYFNYRQKLDRTLQPLSHPASAGMVVVYAGTYALARQISDGMGEIRLEQLAQGQREWDYNWTDVMSREANWTLMKSEMALRPHYSIAGAWATVKATRWNAQFYHWMADRVGWNLAHTPSYAYERLAHRGIRAVEEAARSVEVKISRHTARHVASPLLRSNIDLAASKLEPVTVFVVKAGVVVAAAAVVVRGTQGALRLYRREYQGGSEQAREIGWAAAGGATAAVGLHQAVRSRALFRTFSAGDNVVGSFTRQVLYFNDAEKAALARNGTGWRLATGRTALVAAGAYGAYEGAQAAWRLATEESEDPVKDGVILAAGATTATLGAVTLFRGRIASRGLVAVADAAAVATASIPSGLALFIQPHRLTALAGDLAITGVPNGFINTGTRVAQGYTQPDVLMAEFARSFVTPLPASVYDIIMRSRLGRITSIGEKIYIGNVTAYQPITIWNQSRATGSMNEAALIRLWSSATPEQRDELAPRISHYNELVTKTVPEQTTKNFREELANFRKAVKLLRTISPQNARDHFDFINDQLAIFEEELKTKTPNQAALGDFVRVVATKLGESTGLGGQHPSLDRIEEELDRLESTLKEANRWTAQKRLVADLRRQIKSLNDARREFFSAIGRKEDVDTAKKLYRFRGLERHLKTASAK